METDDKTNLTEALNRGFAKIMSTNDDDADADAFGPSTKDIEGWTANQVVVFLEKVEGFNTPLSKENSQLMAKRYNFMESKNVEVVSRYFRVGLKARDEAVYQPTAELLGKVGRMKFVRPLYVFYPIDDLILSLEEGSWLTSGCVIGSENSIKWIVSLRSTRLRRIGISITLFVGRWLRRICLERGRRIKL